jgi:MFS family permease
MRIRDARLYLVGQAFSMLGDSALLIAAAIWVKELTGSNGAAGLTFFFVVAPSLCAPLAGVLVDRVRRRAVLLWGNALTGLAMLPLLLVHDAGQVWIVWLVMVLYGVSYTVLGPAQSALLPSIVPDELLADANALLRSVREGLRLFAPLLGAGLLTVAGGAAVAALDAATFVIAVLSLLAIRVVEPPPDPAEREHWRREVSAGFRHVAAVPALLRMTVATAVVLLVVGFLETAPFAVVAQGLHQPPTFLGVLQMVQGAGAVAGGLTAAPVLRRLGESVLAALGMLLLAAGSALLIVPSMPVVLAGGVVLGASLSWLLVGSNTLLQRRTPDRLQGRVFAAVDLATSTPQTVSIAAGAALIAVVPYGALLGAVAIVTAGAGLGLLRGERRDQAKAIGRTPRSGSSGVSRARRSPTASSSSGT